MLNSLSQWSPTFYVQLPLAVTLLENRPPLMILVLSKMMFYFDNNSIFNEIQTSDLVYTKKWTNKTNANAFAEKKVILFQKHVAPTGFMLWKKHISGARAAAMLTKNVSSGVAAGANSFLQELGNPATMRKYYCSILQTACRTESLYKVWHVCEFFAWSG